MNFDDYGFSPDMRATFDNKALVDNVVIGPSFTKIDKDEFDAHVIWPGKVNNLNFFHNSFKTYEDLIKGATNNYNSLMEYTNWRKA